MPRRRKNPTLVVLSNPALPPGVARAWEKLHWRDSSKAEVVSVPDIPGVPKGVVALGAFTGLEVDDGMREDGGEEVTCRWTASGGPWLVTDERCRRLWAIAKRPGDLSSFRDLDGEVCAAIYYFPPSNSAKHDRKRGFRHLFGEGGNLPRRDWPSVWPRIRVIHERAILISGPSRGGFVVTERGIVG